MAFKNPLLSQSQPSQMVNALDLVKQLKGTQSEGATGSPPGRNDNLKSILKHMIYQKSQMT